MEENTLNQIKELLTEKTNELQTDNDNITKDITTYELCVFEQKLFNDSEYFDKQYFDESKFENGIRTLFGEFPIEDFTDEADDYRKLYVYNRALKAFVSELNGL